MKEYIKISTSYALGVTSPNHSGARVSKFWGVETGDPLYPLDAVMKSTPPQPIMGGIKEKGFYIGRSGAYLESPNKTNQKEIKVNHHINKKLRIHP